MQGRRERIPAQVKIFFRDRSKVESNEKKKAGIVARKMAAGRKCCQHVNTTNH